MSPIPASRNSVSVNCSPHPRLSPPQPKNRLCHKTRLKQISDYSKKSARFDSVKNKSNQSFLQVLRSHVNQRYLTLNSVAIKPLNRSNRSHETPHNFGCILDSPILLSGFDPSALIPFYFFYLIYRAENLGLDTFLGVEACVFDCYSLVALHGSR